MANNVSLPSSVIEQLSKAIATNPDALTALLQNAGSSQEVIDNTVKEVKSSIAAAETKEARDKFKTEFTKSAIDFGNDELEAGNIPKEMEEFEVRLYFTKNDGKYGSQDVKAGFHVVRFDIRGEGMTKMENLSKIAKSTGRSGGGARSVPIPASLHVKSWKEHLSNVNPTEYEKKEAGAQYSAARVLETLKDPEYLAAKKLWDESGQGNLMPGATNVKAEEKPKRKTAKK